MREVDGDGLPQCPSDSSTNKASNRCHHGTLPEIVLITDLGAKGQYISISASVHQCWPGDGHQ